MKSALAIPTLAFAALAAAALSAALPGCGDGGKPAAAAPEPLAVPLEAIRKREMPLTHEAAGTVRSTAVAVIASKILGEVKARGLRTLEASAEAESAWVATILKYAASRRDYLASCTPGYYNNEGHPDARMERNSQFWRGPMAFIRLLDEWRRSGTMPGLEVTTESPAT